MRQFISVIICTYNRADLLLGSLESIFDQTCAPSVYEVIVVDNNSNDNTKQVVESFMSHANLSYYVESRQGLSYARNLGLEMAKGAYVAYLDDDVRVPSEWLKNLTDIIWSSDPPLDCLGGPILPFYTTEKPPWFKDEYVVRQNRTEGFFLKKGQSLIGANMTWNKESLALIGGFDVNLGVKGNIMIMGEDTSAFHKLWEKKSNPRFYCSPLLAIYHWVSPNQMSVQYHVKRNLAGGRYLFFEFGPKKTMDKIKYFFKKTLSLAKSFVHHFLFLYKYPTLKNWAYEELSSSALIVGELLGLLGVSPKIKNEKINTTARDLNRLK